MLNPLPKFAAGTAALRITSGAVVPGVLNGVPCFVRGDSHGRQRPALIDLGAQTQDFLPGIVMVGQFAGNLLDLNVTQAGRIEHMPGRGSTAQRSRLLLRLGVGRVHWRIWAHMASKKAGARYTKYERSKCMGNTRLTPINDLPPLHAFWPRGGPKGIRSAAEIVRLCGWSRYSTNARPAGLPSGLRRRDILLKTKHFRKAIRRPGTAKGPSATARPLTLRPHFSATSAAALGDWPRLDFHAIFPAVRSSFLLGVGWPTPRGATEARNFGPIARATASPPPCRTDRIGLRVAC